MRYGRAGCTALRTSTPSDGRESPDRRLPDGSGADHDNASPAAFPARRVVPRRRERHLADGRIAVIGKVHHCMVDGIAAVELAGLLVDPTPDAPPMIAPAWRPAPTPDGAALLAGAARDLADRQLELLAAAWRTARAPRD